jgi:hypothetical protein
MRIRILAPVAAGLVATFALMTRNAPAADVAPPVDVSVAADASSAGPTFGDETLGPDSIPGEIAVDLRDDASDASPTTRFMPANSGT